MTTQPSVLPFCAQHIVFVTSWTRPACETKRSNMWWASLSLLFTGSEATWLGPEDIQQKEKELICINIDRTAKWRLQMEIFAHFLCLQANLCLHFVPWVTISGGGCAKQHRVSQLTCSMPPPVWNVVWDVHACVAKEQKSKRPWVKPQALVSRILPSTTAVFLSRHWSVQNLSAYWQVCVGAQEAVGLSRTIQLVSGLSFYSWSW